MSRCILTFGFLLRARAFLFVRRSASAGSSENLKRIMNPRSVGSFVRSAKVPRYWRRDGEKEVRRRSLKLFLAAEETSIILVVYAHVGARLVGVLVPASPSASTSFTSSSSS